MSGTGSVLVVLDGSAQDVATLDWATDEAAALGTGLTVAVVAPWAEAHPGVLVECVALPGSAAAGLLEVSAGASLLVVGARGGAGLPAAMRGSITPVLARRAHCAVVITR